MLIGLVMKCLQHCRNCGWITTADRKYHPSDKKPEIFTTGDSANLLTPSIGDANTTIPESKAFMANVVKKGVK